MKHLLNICNINGAEVEPVDIITFGSPCQDMSVAGKREGMKHAEQGNEETTRSGLFYEAIRIIVEMRKATNGEYPKYAVWENVPGAFSSNKGRDFHAVLEAFCSVCDDAVSIPEPYDKKRTKLVWSKAGEIVGDNYSIAWRTLDAQYWGVPQRRKRIYLVADFTGRRAGEILFKPESLRGDLSQGDEAGQEVAADAMGGFDGSSGNGGQLAATVISSYGTKWNGNAGAYNGENFVLQKPGTNQDMSVVFAADKASTLRAGGGSSINVEQEETSPTLRANSHQHEPVIAMATQQGGAEIAENLCPTITAAAGMSGNNQPVISLQANGVDRADTAGCNGAGWRKNECYTLNTVDRHAVCFDMTHACDVIRECGDVTPTLQNRMGTGGNQVPLTIENAKPPRKYIIRRLTPTECARLQGFPDWWGELAPYNPADAEFWEQVRKTHAEINGKKYKPVKDIKKWYDKLHTDSAEYKAYGNGLALPNAEFVMRGIAQQGAKTLGSLFDGIGGFPLAGAMNGIKPLWASEVEPFPIAVTKSRFKGVQNG
jgi:DNA (cytosine-5)-methyltransferase 1